MVNENEEDLKEVKNITRLILKLFDVNPKF